MRAIAIDDEPFALEMLQDYASRVPFLELVAVFDDAMEALTWLNRNQVDLLLLDIQMPYLSGLQLLKSLPTRPKVIFTTAYSEYAVESYELEAVDYLLKPIPFDRFLLAVNKAQGLLDEQTSTAAESASAPEFMFVKTEHRILRVAFADILYIEGMRDYLRIHTTSQRIMTLQNFKTMEEMLPPARFMRVHRSYIVSLEKIDSVERNLIHVGDQALRISDTYREAFFDRIKQLGLG